MNGRILGADGTISATELAIEGARIAADLSPPAPLAPAAAATLLTLVDFETPLWLDPAAATPAVLAWTRFHCGAPVVDAPEPARFAVVTDPDALLPFDRSPIPSAPSAACSTPSRGRERCTASRPTCRRQPLWRRPPPRPC